MEFQLLLGFGAKIAFLDTHVATHATVTAAALVLVFRSRRLVFNLVIVDHDD